jgi:hypothetical protein
MRDTTDYFWVDSCCIDRESSAELSESINSMFRWYWNAARCYVHLTDISIDADSRHFVDGQRDWKSAFQGSRWCTRGWVSVSDTIQSVV